MHSVWELGLKMTLQAIQMAQWALKEFFYDKLTDIFS